MTDVYVATDGRIEYRGELIARVSLHTVSASVEAEFRELVNQTVFLPAVSAASNNAERDKSVSDLVSDSVKRLRSLSVAGFVTDREAEAELRQLANNIMEATSD